MLRVRLLLELDVDDKVRAALQAKLAERSVPQSPADLDLMIASSLCRQIEANAKMFNGVVAAEGCFIPKLLDRIVT